MIYITGDVHGFFGRVHRFAREYKTTEDDILIILGDAGINYWGNPKDKKLKNRLKGLNLTLLCVHGNHEMRPETLESYHEHTWRGGAVYVEEAYPRLLFARDGSIFNLDGKDTLVIGGAYSVDKYWRIEDGRAWFADEQPSDKIKQHVELQLDACGWKVDTVLSHTCPYGARPLEAFLPSIDQATVDNSTELWLQTIADRLTFKHWYFGHFHYDKTDGPYRALFKTVEDFCDHRVVYTEEDDLQSSYR